MSSRPNKDRPNHDQPNQNQPNNDGPRQPAGRDRPKSASRKLAPNHNTKHAGELAEMEFMLQAHARGFPVAKPFGDNEHYDVLVDSRRLIWRVQVKLATHYRNQTYSLHSHWSGYKHLTPYTPDDIDFLVGFVHPHKVWYLIPAAQIKGRLTLNLYPLGARRGAAEFEKYKEAWHLLTPNP